MTPCHSRLFISAAPVDEESRGSTPHAQYESLHVPVHAQVRAQVHSSATGARPKTRPTKSGDYVDCVRYLSPEGMKFMRRDIAEIVRDTCIEHD